MDRVVQLDYVPEMNYFSGAQVRGQIMGKHRVPGNFCSEENICINNDMSGRDVQPSRDGESRMSSEM